MTDFRDLEDALSRYRPAGPRHTLRMRVVLGVPPAVVRGTWGLAAAALAAAIGLHVAASSALARLDDPRRAQELEWREGTLGAMTEALGGGEVSRRAAERWLKEVEQPWNR